MDKLLRNILMEVSVQREFESWFDMDEGHKVMIVADGPVY